MLSSFTVIWPVAVSKSNLSASVPDMPYSRVEVSGSVAVIAAPTLVPSTEFSLTLRAGLSGSFGLTLARLPLSDHGLSPSSFRARTCTS